MANDGVLDRSKLAAQPQASKHTLMGRNLTPFHWEPPCKLLVSHNDQHNTIQTNLGQDLPAATRLATQK